MFRDMEASLGTLKTLDAFEGVTDPVRADLKHDVYECRECWNVGLGEFVYCSLSRSNVDHPYHVFHLSQMHFCLCPSPQY